MGRLLGFKAEMYASELLKRKGYKIIKHNYYTKFSEIDLIAIKDNTLVFVEVKARWNNKFGSPEDSVNKFKLERIKRSGQLYSANNPRLPKKMRVDVVSLIFDKDKVVSEKIIRVY